MSLRTFAPTKQNEPINMFTTNDLADQIWNEFIGLRHGTRNSFSSKAITYDIDQARVYFLDAIKSNWRSSGLLYYYSFLNLARAHLISKKKVKSKATLLTPIYHGLRKSTNFFPNIMDFEVIIEPPIKNGFINIFSCFYETVTNQNWPFTTSITLNISDIIGYCSDISGELLNLFTIKREPMIVYSILRADKSDNWLEYLVPDSKIITFLSNSGTYNLSTHKFLDLPPIPDQSDWRLVFPSIIFNQGVYSILRSDRLQENPKNQKFLLNQAIANIGKNYSPCTTHTESNFEWLFMPDLTTNGKTIIWHSIFSDYIIAFALSTILRYQPQILKNGTANSYIMEAWCNESSITALKYFLMLFTDPPRRLQKY